MRRLRIVSLGMLTAMLLGSLLATTVVADPPANMPFQRTWQYTDAPVAEGLAIRSWIWGPSAYSAPLTEMYEEAPGVGE